MDSISRIDIYVNKNAIGKKQFLFAIAIYAKSGEYGLSAVSDIAIEELRHYINLAKTVLIGQNPLSYELNISLLRELRLKQRAVIPQEVLSALDTALMDISSKLMKMPLYQLLGGRIRNRINASAGIEYFKPENTNNNFKIAKLHLKGASYYGREGLKENLHCIEEAAQKLPGSTLLCLECAHGMDSEYIIRLLKEIKNYKVRYMELPLTNTGYESMRRFRDILNPNGIMLMASETSYTLYSARELIGRHCIDLLRCDVAGSGGISELRKISAYAQANGTMLVPVGAGRANLHFAASSLSSPFIELSESSEELLFGRPDSMSGAFEISDKPGIGNELPSDFIQVE